MTGLCLVVAGVVAATLPGEAFTLAWTHSVQKTRWEERYRVGPEGLRLVEAYVEGSGAGMEAPPEAKRDGRGWRWTPDRFLPSLTLAGSPSGGAYRLCSVQRCLGVPLEGSSPQPVTLMPCATRPGN